MNWSWTHRYWTLWAPVQPLLMVRVPHAALNPQLSRTLRHQSPLHQPQQPQGILAGELRAQASRPPPQPPPRTAARSAPRCAAPSARSAETCPPRKQQSHAFGPGKFVYDELGEACGNDQYTCGAVLLSDGHMLAADFYCNALLTCAAPVKSKLYNLISSALKQPFVNFQKRTWCCATLQRAFPGSGLRWRHCEAVACISVVQWVRREGFQATHG